MSYAIIGGGISGLYCAYSLHKKFGINDITIIEKDNRLGGRINSIYIDGTTLEMGAGAIPGNHYREMKLLEELNLLHKLDAGGSGRSYSEISTISTKNFISGPAVPTIYQINKIVPLEKTNFYNILWTIYWIECIIKISMKWQ